jgi:hypothetical protein
LHAQNTYDALCIPFYLAAPFTRRICLQAAIIHGRGFRDPNSLNKLGGVSREEFIRCKYPYNYLRKLTSASLPACPDSSCCHPSSAKLAITSLTNIMRTVLLQCCHWFDGRPVTDNVCAEDESTFQQLASRQEQYAIFR